MPLVETKHGPLHYEFIDHVAPWESERPPILLHHGIGGCAGMWSGWLPHLIDRYRIVTWDMRGYGRSAAAGFDWSLDLLVSDVFAVADAVGMKQFHLVGESIGGTVALAAAIAKPDRLSTLTVSNGAQRLDSAGGSLAAATR
jgi:pimeloyl-ACP methyl ester carboxylesterase